MTRLTQDSISAGQAITPLNVSVTDVTTSSISVEFIPSVLCLDHVIDIGLSGSSSFVVERLLTNYTYTETGLDEGTSYFFEIAPVVDSAFGITAQRSAPIHVRTLSGKLSQVNYCHTSVAATTNKVLHIKFWMLDL